ncbi:UNVERIFIED_CONTAM: hypothetical protein PYX00_007813 [Menopon gallinae]|uniref:XRCC4 N-terminal domain-containing protein n=1 Tax=Menopon gallinae TaxID=328185 RepID=A0AAW2HLP4_9NEOP
MDCIENENVCTVKKENNSGYYRIHTIWKKDGFRVNIASKDGAWAGEMTAENIISMCGILKLEPEKYLAECKEALTTDDGKPGYSYTFENGCFTWKKMIDEDSGIKIRMGSVLVKCVNFIDTIQNILEAAINCKKQLNNQLMNLYQINEMQQQSKQ